jgi:hypothetical protein
MSAIAAAALAVSAGGAGAASLSDLVAGTTLVEGDVVFDGFFFDDRFGVDFPGDTRTETPFAGDRPVSADQIEITTSSTASTVTLTATIAPPISIMGVDASTGFEHLFDFFLDFDVAISGSARTFSGVSLGGGDLFATGTDGLSEVVYDEVGGAFSNLEIFEDTEGVDQSSDMRALMGLTALSLEGVIEGETETADATAGLSTFSLTFALDGDPPMPVIPTPAALPLMLGALGGLGLFARRRRG